MRTALIVAGLAVGGIDARLTTERAEMAFGAGLF
jgi:hypothetical protein